MTPPLCEQPFSRFLPSALSPDESCELGCRILFSTENNQPRLKVSFLLSSRASLSSFSRLAMRRVCDSRTSLSTPSSSTSGGSGGALPFLDFGGMCFFFSFKEILLFEKQKKPRPTYLSYSTPTISPRKLVSGVGSHTKFMLGVETCQWMIPF